MLIVGFACMNAQSSIDGYSVSQSDLRGTARFMSMAGAFGALGGDLSTLTQNPGGIGVYRSGEIGVTLDFNFQSTNANGYKDSQMKVYCDNFGYVGTVNLGNSSALKTFNWGATYSRKANFDRNYGGSLGTMPTSLTNYIASFTSGAYTPSELLLSGSQNPYQGVSTTQGMIYPDWLSILSYNSGMINPLSQQSTSYYGLYQQGTANTADFAVSERGYIDEYSINFGGNVSDVFYWGIGIGITDLNFSRQTYYGETFQNGLIPDASGTQFETGTGYFDLNNYKKINGSGYNIKLGVIVKPTDVIRLGFAFHTPTWYSLNIGYDASTDFNYGSGFNGYEDTDVAYFEYNMRSPWKIIASAAFVAGGRLIVSADYERAAYDAIHFSDNWGSDYSYENQDIKDYFQASNTVRVGAEYRVTPRLSVRAGYSYSGDNVKKEALDQDVQIYTSGTDPSFTFNKTTQYYTCGLGYKSGPFYIDAAYVHRSRDNQYQPFTNWQSSTISVPTAQVSQTDNNLVFTVGYRF